MVDPTLVLTIDRTSLSLSPLVMSGSSAAPSSLSVVGFQEPAMQARLNLAPQSRLIHGDQATGWAWQQTMLSFQVAALGAASEAAARTAVEELIAAVGRFSFTVTDTVAGAADRVWSCNAGSVVPAGDRTYADLKYHDPVWSVTIPAYPIWSAP